MALMRVFCFGNSHLWAMVGSPGRSDELIEVDIDGIHVLGWKLGSSGATAYSLDDESSETQAGSSLIRILDSYRNERKKVFMVFGEVDVTDHIGKHGDPEDLSISETIERYMQFCSKLAARDDVCLIAIASTIPHSAEFNRSHDHVVRISRKWNVALKESCLSNGFTYVDWYESLIGSNGEITDNMALHPNDPNERHMNYEVVRSILANQLRSSFC